MGRTVSRAPDAAFTTDHDARATHRRTLGAEARPRLITLGLGVALGLAGVAAAWPWRIAPDTVAMGQADWAATAEFGGHRITASNLPDYAGVWGHARQEPGPLALWLGNSQSNTINQRTEADRLAAHWASVRWGHPTYVLQLPNASLQEHLVVLQWALAVKRPDWLVLPVFYDDLRETVDRPGLERLLTPEVSRALAARPEGKRLAHDLVGQARTKGEDTQGTTRDTRSLMDLTEGWLQERLSATWPLWRDRNEILARVYVELYRLRNWAFRIESSSKRSMISVRYQRNMNALAELLDVAHDAGLRVLVYVPPIRWDVEPPYDLTRYGSWKQELAADCARRGVLYADLDAVVPSDQYGSCSGVEVDFMHFRGKGHEILGGIVGEILATGRVPERLRR